MRDVVGAWLSLLCMLHCFLPIILLSIGLSIGAHELSETMHNDWFHFLLLIPIIALLAVSLPQSYRQHKQHQPIILAVIGIGILILALLMGEQYETTITIVGSIFVISAHLINRRLSKPSLK